MDIERFYEEAEVRYELKVYVNDEFCAKATGWDTDSIIEKLPSMEEQVAQHIDSQFHDKVENARDEMIDSWIGDKNAV